MLSACTRYWLGDPPTQSRGVVEMHAFVLVNGHWTDVTSQSITVNFANYNTFANSWEDLLFSRTFGADTRGARVPAGQRSERPNRLRVGEHRRGRLYMRFFDTARVADDRLQRGLVSSLPPFAVQALRHHQQARLRLAGAQPATLTLR